MPNFWTMCRYLKFIDYRFPEPGVCPTRQLSAFERATARVTVPAEPFVEFSVVGEAAFRLQRWHDSGWLWWASAHAVARRLQASVLAAGFPQTWPLAKRGWTLLAEMDRVGAAVVWVHAEPVDGLGPRRRMRLHERVAELESRG